MLHFTLFTCLLVASHNTDPEEKEIPLTEVTTEVLTKIVEYMNYHVEHTPREIEKPIISTRMTDFVDEWDAKFIDVSQQMLFDLLLVRCVVECMWKNCKTVSNFTCISMQAANYLDLKSLLDLACAKVATLIKGKTPEQIREQFNITNDFTPEEEQQVREENSWAE